MATEIVYATLDLALGDIAARSFYEAADIIPNDDGTYTVRDSFGQVGDDVTWTYQDGLDVDECVSGLIDHSGLMESYESFDNALQIRNYLSAAIEALEAGASVHFEYQTVNGIPTTAEDIADDEAGLYDAIVGWALIALGA